MSSLTRLVTVAVACAGLLVLGSPADAAGAGDQVTSTSTTTTTTTVVGGSDEAGIQSAGMASRAPGARCGRSSNSRRSPARRHCRPRGL